MTSKMPVICSFNEAKTVRLKESKNKKTVSKNLVSDRPSYCPNPESSYLL